MAAAFRTMEKEQEEKTLESSLIESFPCTNTKAGDVRLAKNVAIALVKEFLG